MKPLELISYSICIDCLHYLANGESPDDYDKDSHQQYMNARAEDMARELNGRTGHFSIGLASDDPEERDGYDEFSTHPCELCNSTLHGSRHGATLIIQGA